MLGFPAWLWRFALRLRVDPALRDRTLGQAVFAAIFAFGLASFDFLVTGGMEWSPDMSAVAAVPAHRYVAVQRQRPEIFEPAPEWITAEVQPLDEMAAPNEDLLGGPNTVLAAWSRPQPDESLLPMKPEAAVASDSSAIKSSSRL